MIGKQLRLLVTLSLLTGLVGTLGGCQRGLMDENARYRTQNQELQEELTRTQAALDTYENERNNLLAEIEWLQAAGTAIARANTGFEGIAGVEAFQLCGIVTVRVPGDVAFASGKANLNTTSKNILQQIAATINRQYANSRVRIAGHTDSDPIRKTRSLWRDNYHLSEARAMAVRDYLASQGIPNARMQVIGKGPDQPVTSNKTRSGKAKNRRVEIAVVVSG